MDLLVEPWRTTLRLVAPEMILGPRLALSNLWLTAPLVAQELARHTMPGTNKIMHSEIRIGDTVLAINDEFDGPSPHPVTAAGPNHKATGSFIGKVEVARGAQKTDAEQSVKAMLLDRGASANCKPELEIFADDVKCAHGASVGELDPMQLFYAESRGLDPANARALLLEGFIMGVWESANDGNAISEAARAALRRVVG